MTGAALVHAVVAERRVATTQSITGEGPDTMIRRLWMVGACVAGIVVAGCSSPSPGSEPTTPSTPVVLPVAAIDCAAGRDPGATRAREVEGTGGAHPGPGEEALVERAPLPEDFAAAAAVLCVETWPGDGGPVVYAQRLADIDIEELVAVLRQGDDPVVPEACTALYDPQPNLWLIDDDGGVLAPRWPLDGCNHLRPPTPEEAIPDAALGDPVPAPATPPGY